MKSLKNYAMKNWKKIKDHIVKPGKNNNGRMRKKKLPFKKPEKYNLLWPYEKPKKKKLPEDKPKKQ